MATNFAAFGEQVNAQDLKAQGLEIEFTKLSQLRVGNTYEAPCSIKTSLREILEVGAFSYINGRGRFTNVRIGRYCSIAESVAVGYPEHPTDWLSTSPIQYMRPPWASVAGDWKRLRHTTTKETTIGHDVWIGAGAFIRTGVSIGTGAVVGAHAVITRDVEPYAIVAGNPGRKLRSRVPQEIIPEILASKWWEFSPTQLSGCPFDKPLEAIKFVAKLRKSGAIPFSAPKLVIAPTGAKLVHSELLPEYAMLP